MEMGCDVLGEEANNSCSAESTPGSPSPGDNMTVGGRVVISVIIGIMAIVAVTGNTLVCLTLLKLKLPARQFLMNLAMSDIILGSLVMPCSIATLLARRWVLGSFMCDLVAFLKTGCLFASTLGLCVIAVDRYLSIKHSPFTITPRQMVAGLLFPWLGAGLTALAPILGWGNYMWSPVKPICTVDWLHSSSYTLFCFVTFGFLPQMFLFLCYMSIARYVHQRKNQVRKQRAFASRSHRVNPEAQTDEIFTINAGQAFRNRHGLKKISREEVGVLKTMVVVVLALFVNVVPYVTLQLVSLQRGVVFSLRAETLSTTLLYLGSCLNPFIYSGGSVKFRRALKKTVIRLFSKFR